MSRKQQTPTAKHVKGGFSLSKRIKKGFKKVKKVAKSKTMRKIFDKGIEVTGQIGLDRLKHPPGSRGGSRGGR